MTTRNAGHAGQAIADSLVRHGVERVYAVPGESYLALLDGLYETKILTVVTRQEGGAGYMAEAHGRFTGKPGVAMVTRGPGAANAFIAVHAAWQDATPMVLFVGLIPVKDRGRESFQEFDPFAWFGTQAKRVLVLEDASRASDVVAEAFHAATSGRPGPVVVGLPEDIVASPFDGEITAPWPIAEGAVSVDDMNSVIDALKGAKRPLLFLGGERWTPQASAQIASFVEKNRIPVLHDWRASDRVPGGSPANAGWLGYGRSDAAAQMFTDADLVVAIGQVPGDVATDGYALRQSADQRTILVNIDAGLRGLGCAFQRHVLASPTAFADSVRDIDLGRADTWQEWCSAGHDAFVSYSSIDRTSLPPTMEGTAHLSLLVEEVVLRLDSGAVTTFGAGNHCHWAQRYFPTEVYPSQLGMRNGSMGYSVPAAIAASLSAPHRQAIAIAGDGEFLMNGQELATAVQYGVSPLIIVADNRQFGTIRAHQEKQFPGRISGTQLRNPSFATLMVGYGGHGETVRSNAEIPHAVEEAFAAIKRGLPALIHIVTDPTIEAP